MTEHEQLLENLIENCNAASAKAFFRRKNVHFKAQNETLENSDSGRFTKVWKIGQLNFEADNVVFAFTDVKAELSERSCRKAQFEAARKILRFENADAGIFIFKGTNGAFRLSLVYKAYQGTKAELSPYRRFTYFVQSGSPGNTTFKRQLGGCAFDSLEAVKKSFSLEPVNKEFYSRIQKHFYGLVGGKVDDRNDFTGCMALPSKPLDQPENHKAYQEFAVRLLGRVVFCWFLKHKRCDQNRPLIPHELLSSEAVQTHSDYYHGILEKLFFQTLNKPMNERSKYAPEFAHLIPYLNGGLFDPHRDDFYEEGVLGISRFAATLKIPDGWFLELFQTLEQYNFTIDENTSLDTDVSIDPEILGRIFENLLAEINPETGDSARKATGSFYTPREIVDYMVEESLVQHLKTALGVTTEHTERTEGDGFSATGNSVSSVYSVVEKNLRDLFVDDAEPHNLDDKTRRAVVNAFRTIKVLDPACGSGAFPVGILQKMLCALRKVDPENDLWLTAQIEQIQSMKLSRQEENRRLDEIGHAFKTNEADYGRKLGIIQNSVYGVDIQPIAIEISKLRFFLTLVVDEKIEEKEDNRGILPLPNLDFKFVCANTLIPAPEIDNQSGELDLEYYPDFFKDFTSLTEHYFYAGTPAEKKTIREQLSGCVSKKIKGELDKVHVLQGNDLFEHHGLSKAKQKKIKERRTELVRNINLWESYKNIFSGETVGFFDPKYMFPDAAEGFDVVIANPPYGADISKNEQAQIMRFMRDTPNTNSAAMFVDYAKNRLIKSNGIVAHIVPKSLLYSEKWLSLAIALNEGVIALVDVEKAFENVKLEQVIFIYTLATKAPEYFSAKFINGAFANTALMQRTSIHVFQAWICGANSKELQLAKKIRMASVPLNTMSQTKRGIGVQKHSSDNGDIPLIGGRNIARYSVSGVYGYLSKKVLNEYAGKVEFLSQEKVISQDVIAHIQNPTPHIKITAAYDSDGSYFGLDTVQNTVLSKNAPISYRFLMAIMNTVTTNWFVYNFVYCRAIRTMHFDSYYIGRVPVPSATSAKQAEIEALVGQILALKKENPEADISALETEIDQLIYKLYNLTSDEIDIIEGRA